MERLWTDCILELNLHLSITLNKITSQTLMCSVFFPFSVVYVLSPYPTSSFQGAELRKDAQWYTIISHPPTDAVGLANLKSSNER
jgi:hypothetical protein